MANATAQIMHLHRIVETPLATTSVPEVVSREIQKRVWCFLCIQDSYLIVPKRCYSINMSHCTTPLPANCEEEEATISHNGVVAAMSPEQYTQSTYQLLQLQMTNISRALFDNISSLEHLNAPLPDIYTKVLEADASLIKLAQGLPSWLKPAFQSQALPLRHNPDSIETVKANLQRTIRISLCQVRLSIHRSFFCRGITDKRFHYSYSTCLDAARTILRSYRASAALFEVDCWTIPAHAISACNILMLKTVFTRLVVDFAGDAEERDQDLMEECMALVQGLRGRNRIVDRGLTMIGRLMEGRSGEYRTLGEEEMERLVGEVEGRISGGGDVGDMGEWLDDSIWGVFDSHYPL